MFKCFSAGTSVWCFSAGAERGYGVKVGSKHARDKKMHAIGGLLLGRGAWQAKLECACMALTGWECYH
eukprot:scaffold11967_cov23-Tisochrysis_lutea.AAC.3